MTARYSPKPVPSDLPPSARAWLQGELARIAGAIQEVEAVNLFEQAAEPARLDDGLIAYADGSNWNPGKGEGIYCYVNAAWVSLSYGDLAGASNETISGDWTFTGTVTIASGAANVAVSHDGTDLNIAGTTTTDINLTGITALNAGTVDADFDAITATSYDGIAAANLVDKTASETISGATWAFQAITAVSFGGIASANLVDKSAAETITGLWEFNGDIRLDDNDAVRFGTSDDFTLSYDGTSLDFVPISAGDQINMLNGSELRIWDSSDANHIEMLCDGTVARVNNSGADSLYLDGGIPGIGIKAMSLSDDATGTWTLPDSRPGGLLFLTASSSGSNATGEYVICYVDDATTITIIASSAATISVGNGANPDVDGDINVWSGTQGIISVKNRRGSTRRIQLYLLGC